MAQTVLARREGRGGWGQEVIGDLRIDSNQCGAGSCLGCHSDDAVGIKRHLDRSRTGQEQRVGGGQRGNLSRELTEGWRGESVPSQVSDAIGGNIQSLSGVVSEIGEVPLSVRDLCERSVGRIELDRVLRCDWLGELRDDRARSEPR